MRKGFLSLLLILTVANSLTLQDLPQLLYPEEVSNNVSITYYNFTVGGSSYSLIYIGGEPALFAKDGTILELRSEIRGPLWENYSATYTPENLTGKLEEMRSLIDAFNESRFDGPGREEEGCRIALGEPYAASFNPNLFSSIYEYYATVICTDTIGEELNCKDASDLLPGIEGFFTPSYDLDAKVSLVKSNLNISDPKDVYPNMVEVLEALDAIESDVQQIKQNEFRYPLNDQTGEPDLQECPTCKPLCYELIHNQTALDQLRALAQELADRTEPLFRFESIVESVYQSTQERKDFKENYDQREAYRREANQTLKGWDSLKERVDAVLERVDDPSLSKYVNDVEKLRAELEDALENNDFTLADQKLNVLKNTVALVAQRTSSYEETISQLDRVVARVDALYLSIKDNVGLLSDLDPAQTQAQFTNLKANLSKKMSPDDLNASIEVALSLETSLIKESKQQRSSLIGSTFKGLQRYHEAFYALLTPLLPPDADSKLQFLRLTPITFSIIVGLSFASLVVWLTVPKFYVKGAHKKKLQKSTKGFFFLLTGLGAFFMFVLISGLAFFAYDEGVNRATLLSFADRLSEFDSLDIVLRSNSPQMLACADSVKSSLEDKNVTVYVSTSTQCLIDGEARPKADCEAATFPMLVMEESSETSISGSSIGDLYLLVKMQSSEFERCPIAAAFSIMEEPTQPETSLNVSENVNTTANTTNSTEGA